MQFPKRIKILINKNTHQQRHMYVIFSSVQSLSRVQLCDPMNRSTPGLPVHHQLPEFTQTHVHRVSDAIQPSHPLSAGRQREESHQWQGHAADIWCARSSQISGFPPGISWACTPQKIRICLPSCTVLLHSPDTLWKKSIQGFSLLHLKGCINPKTPLMAF